VRPTCNFRERDTTIRVRDDLFPKTQSGSMQARTSIRTLKMIRSYSTTHLASKPVPWPGALTCLVSSRARTLSTVHGSLADRTQCQAHVDRGAEVLLRQIRRPELNHEADCPELPLIDAIGLGTTPMTELRRLPLLTSTSTGKKRRAAVLQSGGNSNLERGERY
jgi:hypothetical protein